MKEKYPYLLVILGAMLWGTTGTAQSFAPDGAHPIAIGAVRLAVGGAALLLIAIWKKKLTRYNWPLKETILATLGMACYQPLFFMAVSMTGIAIGTIITLSSAPIIADSLNGCSVKNGHQQAGGPPQVYRLPGVYCFFQIKDPLPSIL